MNIEVYNNNMYLFRNMSKHFVMCASVKCTCTYPKMSTVQSSLRIQSLNTAVKFKKSRTFVINTTIYCILDSEQYETYSVCEVLLADKVIFTIMHTSGCVNM